MDDYLRFDHPVPLRDDGGYREAVLRAVADPRAIGRALQGQSVRPLLDQDFVAIVNAGFAETLAPANAQKYGLEWPSVDPATAALLREPLAEREVERMLVNRTIRDATFRRSVLNA